MEDFRRVVRALFNFCDRFRVAACRLVDAGCDEESISKLLVFGIRYVDHDNLWVSTLSRPPTDNGPIKR